MTDNDLKLKEITSRLIKIYKPEEIYLFGSYAWGTPGKNSDIDLFIIVEKSDLDRAERIRVGLRALLDLNIPVDILVYTKDEVEEKKNHPSTLTHKILTRGVKLYEAA
jgi:predicted nucleotidyltransferase